MENTLCDICSTSLSGPFLKYDFKFFPCRVSLCPSCSLVKLSPRWSASKYQKFYTTHYDQFYRNPEKSIEDLFQEDLATKGQILKERLLDVPFPDKIKLLDVGAGTGFAFLTLPESVKVESFAIETSDKCLPYLKSNGVSIQGTNFSDNFGQGYDFVVARHVLEHVLDPIRFLKDIRLSLKDTGYAYIAVPNAFYFNRDKAHSFFRHIHTYYFNHKTLQLICEAAGLYPFKYGHNGDIWAILQKTRSFDRPIPDISPEEQLNIVNQYLDYSHQPFKRRMRTFLERLYHRAF